VRSHVMKNTTSNASVMVSDPPDARPPQSETPDDDPSVDTGDQCGDTDDPGTDDPAAGADENAASPTVGRSSRRGLLRRRSSIAAVSLVMLASLAGNGWLGWQWQNQRDVAAASQQALNTATRYAVTLTSIDPNSVDQNFTEVLNGATGEFKDMYTQSSAQLRQLLIDNKATSSGTVSQAGIKSATKNEVEVVLFVDQSVTNTSNTQPRIDRSRIVITMEHIDGRWLASKVELA
jgi:Mce-associated membrane protein